MKLIFLDIDGVMNSTRNTERVNTLKQEGVFAPEAWPGSIFAPWSIKALNEIVQQTHAVIVISSRWRGAVILPLEYQGVKANFLGATLGSKGPPDQRNENAKCRGDEILGWLDWFESDVEKMHLWGKVTHIAIIDDDADMERLMPALVQTDPAEGLTQEDADKVISVLCGPDNWPHLK